MISISASNFSAGGHGILGTPLRDVEQCRSEVNLADPLVQDEWSIQRMRSCSNRRLNLRTGRHAQRAVSVDPIWIGFSCSPICVAVALSLPRG